MTDREQQTRDDDRRKLAEDMLAAVEDGDWFGTNEMRQVCDALLAAEAELADEQTERADFEASQAALLSELAATREEIASQTIACNVAVTQAAAIRERADGYRIEGDHAHDDYEDAEAVIRQIADARPNKTFDPWARDLCRTFLDRPASKTVSRISATRERAERAEKALEFYRDASGEDLGCDQGERARSVLARLPGGET